MQQSQTRARRRQFPQTAPTAQTAQIAQMAQIAIVVVVALLTAVASTALAAPPPPPPHNAVHSHHAGRRVLQQLQNEHAPSTLSSHNDDRNSVRALLADAEQPLLQPPASRRRHNNGVATHKPQSADGDGAADQAHATGGRRGGPSDHESSPPAAESLFTASNCKVVGECEECARFEARLKPYCVPWGNKQQLECSLADNPPATVYQSCPRSLVPERRAFYKFFTFNLLFGMAAAVTMFLRRRALDRIAHVRLQKQIGA
ncbi:hypothetical protein CAOG_01893 [Capsaspora owczarzaki ATCC 30864]|uniref:Jumping translocation breakpoint protein n=1 Tax=Capsaspora owczarzaki (strain ATCC 30864) TaxID=595528 RepID=A0A0D2WLD1_CAPO3|nr:hypothetical protein CAOG_01893 [Capsaspora owczarzaki ATCC 30864]KJE90603.1 hypothetical protein, variant 4 [Capsaspora owczarzaki ATCC 30864]|eukprot:XP_004364761.2 hypothetical protein CAOG_01893 [Capsaspora owczarzaki ATCC 30864]